MDPAAGRSELAAIRESAAVGVIVNTHYHEDHLTYNYMFPDAEIWIHEDDAPGIESIDSFFDMSIGAFMDAAIREAFVSFYQSRFHFEGWNADRLLEGGDLLFFGDTAAEVVHLPGHTPGHIGLHFPDERLLFCSDVDMTSFGPYYGDRVSSIDDTIESINKVKEFDADFFITSHLGPVRDRQEIERDAAKYLETIQRRDELVLENLSGAPTLDELARMWLIYRKPKQFDDMFLVGEKAMLRKQLDRLIKNGHVSEEDGRYVRR